jgi:hypothetical protein
MTQTLTFRLDGFIGRPWRWEKVMEFLAANDVKPRMASAAAADDIGGFMRTSRDSIP